MQKIQIMTSVMGRQALLNNMSIRNSMFKDINIVVDDRLAILKGEEVIGAMVEVDPFGDAPIRFDTLQTEIFFEEPTAEVENIRQFIAEHLE